MVYDLTIPDYYGRCTVDLFFINILLYKLIQPI